MENKVDDEVLKALQQLGLSGSNGQQANENDVVMSFILLGMRRSLEKAYSSQLCNDNNCKICHNFVQGKPVPCRNCSKWIQPHTPQMTEICQYHHSADCLQLESFSIDGKAPNQSSSSQPSSTMSNGLVLGYGERKTPTDSKWGVKKCGCKIHILRWSVCNNCIPQEGKFKEGSNAISWRHYVEQPKEESSNKLKETSNNTAQASSDAKCCICGKSNSMKLCSRCKKARYCSVECQKKDWPSHRQLCTNN